MSSSSKSSHNGNGDSGSSSSCSSEITERGDSSSSLSSYEDSEASDQLYGAYTRNDQGVDDWRDSPDGLWRCRRMINYNERDSGWRGWIYFDIENRPPSGGEEPLFVPTILKSHRIRIQGTGRRMGHYDILDSGDWRGTGWDEASWLEENPNCLRFTQSRADGTQCPDVFVMLPSTPIVDVEGWTLGVRAKFVPCWTMDNQVHFPATLRRKWLEHGDVLKDLGIPPQVLPQIQCYYMDMLGHRAKKEELRHSFPDFAFGE